MDKETRDALKEVLFYLLAAWKLEHNKRVPLLTGESLWEQVIAPLQKIVELTAEEKQELGLFAKEFPRETQGKTIQETSDRLNWWLKAGKTAAAAGLASGIIGGILYAMKKEKEKD